MTHIFYRINAMRSVYLESPRLILKNFLETDFEYLVELDGDPEVMKYLTDGKPTLPSEAKEIIAAVMRRADELQHKLGVWIAFDKESHAFVGWFHLRPLKDSPNDHRNLDLGYRLKREYWRKGLASEVSLLLIEKAFSDLKADTVFATTMALNKGSIGVMKKVGLKFHSNFTEEQFPGTNKNAVRYFISRSDWSQEKASDQ
jgi:RimJ/RimL family protein N-acetyltransferase